MSSRKSSLRRTAVLTLSPLFLVGLAAGCGRGGGSTASPTGGATQGSAKAVKIAVVTRDFTNPYWAALRDGAVAEGKARGVQVDVQAGSSETDSAGENAKISTMANQGYTCFGVVPVNSTNVITPLVPVAKKNIPILNLDTQIDPAASKSAGVSYKTFIGSDNLEAGKIAGKALLAKAGDGAEVVMLQGIAGEQNGINREKGFKDATSGHLKLVQSAPADYDQAKGLQVATAMLTAHPNIKGIFAANDTMGLGAARAVQNAGKTGKIAIISVDGITAALDAVKKGTLTGTVTQYPYAEGQMAVQACMALAQGKTIPERVVAPIKLIDTSNVAKAQASFPKPFVPFDNPLAALLK